MTVFAADAVRIAPDFRPLLRAAGLDAEAVFSDGRVVAWRRLADRDNCTMDLLDERGEPIRLHVKRYHPARDPTPAEREAAGHRLLEARGIPTAPLAAWGVMRDGRSFTIWPDLAGYTPADKWIAAGAAFEPLLAPTAELAARLHDAGLHHRDLYLCHFMVRAHDAGVAEGCGGISLRLIDVARVRPLGWPLLRRRWIVKDLAQFWHSTMAHPITDADRRAWLDHYAAARNDPSLARRLIGPIRRKADRIRRHDARLTRRQPSRNISIPTTAPP